MSLHELDGFGADLKALRTRFNQLIARLDQRVKALVEASPERKQNFTRLCTITGVGPVTGTALVNILERVPLKSADAFVAFTGLGPRPDDSGQHRGKRRLSKRGPGELRRLLYMAAMSAVKTKTWKPLAPRRPDTVPIGRENQRSSQAAAEPGRGLAAVTPDSLTRMDRGRIRP
jgi:transposase